MIKLASLLYSIFLLSASCSQSDVNQNYSQSDGKTLVETTNPYTDTIIPTENHSANKWDYADDAQKVIVTGNTTPQQLLSFAETLQGIPYKYGSIDPNNGFDCSGFISYVFNHFNIAVPRSSKDFTNVQREIPISKALPGDIILFTGTDSTIRVVGHMGIITSKNNNQLSFIHSTSGKADGVTTTPFNSYYQGRFVKTLRIFNNEQ